MTRKEYALTTAQYDKLIEACKAVPLIMLQCGMPPSAQENANRAWCALGKELGFDGMSVRPSSKGKLFFTADETAVEPRTAAGSLD